MLTPPQEICVHPVIVWEVAALIRLETEVLSYSLDIRWNPNPQCEGLRRWGHEGRRQLGHEGRVLMSRISGLTNETPESPLTPSIVWGHGMVFGTMFEDIVWGYGEGSLLTRHWLCLDLGFPGLQNCVKKMSVVSATSLWHFCYNSPKCFRNVVMEKTLETPWTERSNQSNQ